MSSKSGGTMARSLAARFDSALAARFMRRPVSDLLGPWRVHMLPTQAGVVRALDTGASTDKPCVVIVPDGPSVVEHYVALIERLSRDLRVVCFDMPGFGFSAPAPDYGHSLREGAGTVLAVMDALEVPTATLAFSCANGFYALRAARSSPPRIRSLFLAQTPSLEAMHAWVERVVAKPFRVPVLGQAANWLGRQQLASHWYGLALPANVDRAPFRSVARQALARGACFSLAGVVQGLSADSQQDIAPVDATCTLLWGDRDRTQRKTDPMSLLACAPTLRSCAFPKLATFRISNSRPTTRHCSWPTSALHSPAAPRTGPVRVSNAVLGAARWSSGG